MRNQSFIGIIATILGSIVLIIAMSALLALPVMLLWNAVLVAVFPSVSTVSFLQAWGLNLLCGFLFKGGSVSSSSK